MPLVDRTHHDGVTTVTLDSPDNRNALSAQLIDELRAAVAEEDAADRTHVLVLTAVGGTFCAGVDLAEVRERGGIAASGRDLVELLRTLMDGTTPTVARVNGHVRGGGMGLVGACDIAVAPSAATFAFSEVRLGVAPAMVAPAVVPRLDPRAASRYLLTGETFDAAEATRIGLLTAATRDLETLDDLLDDLLAALREGSPAAQAATKRVLREVARPLPADAFPAMRALSEELFASEEAQRRIAALLDGR